MSLPQDELLPGEELDAGGHAIPLRQTSYLTANSVTVCGSSYYQVSLISPTLVGRALQLTSGKPDAYGLNWAIYRLPLGGEQPALIGTDINLFTISEISSAGYWLGISNYGTGNWDWQGPYTTNHVRLSTALASRQGADYLSGLGNLFICVVAYRGAGIEIVGVSADTLGLTDTAAPATPLNLYAKPVKGGYWLTWDGNAEEDLAGYRVYYSEAAFINTQENGVMTLNYLRHIPNHLHVAEVPLCFRVSAVDLSGNESALSEMDYATAAAGPPLSVNMDSDFTTGPIDFTFNLTINGGDIFSWDLDADGEFEFPDTTNDQLELPVTVARMLRPAVLAESGTTGAGLLSLSLLAYQNEDPVADLQASDYVDDAPMNVEFDASGSMDPDGYIVDYEWDLDGDDIYSENGAEADARGLTIVNHTYEQAGLYNVTVRITDDSGAQDAATVLIRVKGWIVVTIATSSLHLGENVSLAAVDGWPAICYEDLSIQQQLKYIRATTSTGTSAKDWPESIAVDPTCQVGSGSSLAVIDGNPAVAFYDGVNFNLKYARSSTSTGIGEYDWQPSFTVDNNSAVGEDPSLTIIDGNPAISYYDLSNGRLKYARANNSTGVGGNVWTTRLTIDDAEQVGSASRLATIDGHPAISYSDNFTQRLKYVRADTADGADADDWTQLVNLDDTYFLGGCHNLATVSTRPALACFVDINPPDHDTYELRYFRALSSSGSLGTDWSDYVVIDNCQLGGDFAEIMLSDGLPLVAYFGGTADELKCAWSDTETGAHATDWSMDTIDAAFDKGQAVSMAEIAGAPAIAYIVETGTYTKALRYAWWYD